MRWDIFCKVIDNFGDIGVCWRLSADLASRGEQVRLWVDDASALRWMAPGVGADGLGHAGVQVLLWPSDGSDFSSTLPGHVVIEAFGCHLPDGFVARMQRSAPPHWINLEYLSAESHVERNHGLNSPVWSGPGSGLVKRFFYPGFTHKTGGLIREPGLLDERDRLQADPKERARQLAECDINQRNGERLVLLFCYAQSPVSELLDGLSDCGAGGVPVQILLTPGHAAEQGLAWLAKRQASGLAQHPLRLNTLPALPQPLFDRLLCCTDLNIVRGEDSAVRALWAARPHVWQIYRQDDGVHADKLEAFMARWMHGWPQPLRQQAQTLWRGFNGLSQPRDIGPSLQALWQGDAWSDWQRLSQQAGRELATQNDLTCQLLEFVTQPG